MGPRLGSIVLGVLLLLVGGVWMGQGLGYIRGSFMTGQRLWLVIGLGAALAGLLLIGLSSRRKSA